MAKKRRKKARRKVPVSREGKRPAHWDKRVSAAYLRLLSGTQEEAAKAVGVNERTIRNWESHRSWPDALAEARARWLQGLDSLAMRALRNGLLADDQSTARWWAGKRIKELGGRSESPPPGGLRDHGERFGLVLTPEQLRGMSDEQLEALDAALAQVGAAEPDQQDGDPG